MTVRTEDVLLAIFDGIQKQSRDLNHSIQDAEFSVGYHQGYEDGFAAGVIASGNTLRKLLGFPPEDGISYSESKELAEQSRLEEVNRYRKED